MYCFPRGGRVTQHEAEILNNPRVEEVQSVILHNLKEKIQTLGRRGDRGHTNVEMREMRDSRR